MPTLRCGCDIEAGYVCTEHGGPGLYTTLGWAVHPMAELDVLPIPTWRYVDGDPAPAAAPVPEALLSDGDLGLAPPRRILTSQDILRLGAFTLEQERSEAVLDQLIEQEKVYLQTLKENPQELVKTLLERDKHLLTLGRQVADGRSAGKLLRELLRGLLLAADHASLRAIGDATKTGSIEKILQALGADPADARQLKLHGSTLGPMEDQAERYERLSDGRQKS